MQTMKTSNTEASVMPPNGMCQRNAMTRHTVSSAAGTRRSDMEPRPVEEVLDFIRGDILDHAVKAIFKTRPIARTERLKYQTSTG